MPAAAAPMAGVAALAPTYAIRSGSRSEMRKANQASTPEPICTMAKPIVAPLRVFAKRLANALPRAMPSRKLESIEASLRAL